MANSYVTPAQVAKGEDAFYPLHAYVCDKCQLVQLEPQETPEAIFSDYAYFSSVSSTLIEHARQYSAMIIGRLGLTPGRSFVLEIASNDGYLLSNFVDRQIRCLGIEPAQNVAEAARKAGVPTESVFFGAASAKALKSAHGEADLVIGNNVIAHVPNLHDFIAGVKEVLSSAGTATFEFPHLLQLIKNVEFDTIYHEHFSYFSLRTIRKAFNAHDLEITNVEEIPLHGGSLRIYVEYSASEKKPQRPVYDLLEREAAAGMETLDLYTGFQKKVEGRRDEFLRLLSQEKEAGRMVAAYGAPAKANTFLNYCGVTTAQIPFTVDASPHKQGKMLPGSHIPILEPAHIYEAKPDLLIIMAWNLRTEIEAQMTRIRSWGGRFAVAFPEVTIW